VDDPRTLPTLLDLAEHDPIWQVRDQATMVLIYFDRDVVVPIVRRLLADECADVRWSRTTCSPSSVFPSRPTFGPKSPNRRVFDDVAS
jgi:hypothetical protein